MIKTVYDKNNNPLQVGDMVRIYERYHTLLGIVEKFSTVSSSGIYVKLCGGGGTGYRMISTENAEKIAES